MNQNKGFKLVEMIKQYFLIGFQSRVCSYSLIKQTTIKNELILFFRVPPLSSEKQEQEQKKQNAISIYGMGK